MCSSRLAGAQQPTVLLSLKSSIVAALNQDLQLHCGGKRAAGAKWPCHLFIVLAQKSQCYKPCLHLSLLLWKKTSPSLHSPPSTPHDPPPAGTSPYIPNMLETKGRPIFPTSWKPWKPPKQQWKPTEKSDPKFLQMTLIYHFGQGPILPSGLWHWGTAGRRTSSICLDKNGTSQVD